MNSKNYIDGKNAEKSSWDFLKEKGFVRVNKKYRDSIYEYYLNKKNIEIEPKAYDVIKEKDLEKIGIKDVHLYEVKTTGKKRGKKVSEDFKDFGFTLTNSEKSNAEKLKGLYSFLFVNMNREIVNEYELEDFFNEDSSRIYTTYSVFIKKDLV